MRIRVPHFWQCATVTVPAGDYDADDPRLGGMAEHLIRTEQATIIESEPPPVEHIEDTVYPAAVDSAEKPKRGRGK